MRLPITAGGASCCRRFPNAVKIRAVESPDVRLIPWFNIVFFIVLALVLVWLRTVFVRFRQRRIDPVLDDIDEASDAARSWVGRVIDRVFRRR